MRILEIVSAMGVNGVSKHAIDLGLGLRDRGYEISYLCVGNSWIREESERLGFPTIACNLKRWPDTGLRQVAKEIKSRGIDAVHTHMSKAHFFGVLLRWYAGVPSIATAHSCHLQLHWMFNDYVIAVSDATRKYQQFVNLVPPWRMKTVHNFIKVPDHQVSQDNVSRDVRLSLGLTDQDFVIGVVGRIAIQKGQSYLVEAMPEILKQVPNAKLILIGGYEAPDYVAEMRSYVASNGLEHCVQFLGARSDVPDLLRCMDLLVQPSLWESFPISMLEGMAYGVPIVATDVGGVRECLDHLKSGYLVRAKKVSALRDGVIAMAMDAGLRQRIGDEARKVVRFRFSPESQIARVDEVFQSVVGKRVRMAA